MKDYVFISAVLKKFEATTLVQATSQVKTGKEKKAELGRRDGRSAPAEATQGLPRSRFPASAGNPR